MHDQEASQENYQVNLPTDKQLFNYFGISQVQKAVAQCQREVAQARRRCTRRKRQPTLDRTRIPPDSWRILDSPPDKGSHWLWRLPADRLMAVPEIAFEEK
ncbi:hypothetical protein MNVI_19900 [Mycobacterium noviomagense]|uniref:Uncharacterized protein n=1 Tax=Mycobacterium noviomagense TaxID=459858 RepID=A0A7I7PDM6_9MYCO|nr:hypothetical protein MNVI_19900 [Mycobacterium noviomagense]